MYILGIESAEDFWSESVCERLSELIFQCTLTAFIHASTEDEYLSVTLVNTDTGSEPLFVHKVLLEEGLAKKPEPFPKSPVKGAED